MKRQHILTLALLAQSCLSSTAYALDANTLPDGGNVVSGSAAISQSGAHMDVHQSTDKAIINWQHFDVGRDASVQFHQNNANSVALNRVLTGDASQIQGSISANGHVYLVNPSGVVFGDSARVDVGGLVASTHNISDADFMAGKRVFTRDGATGEIINKGDITAKDEAVLIGTRVDNQGRIVANGGNIALAAGEKVTLNAGADGHLQIAVDGATLDTLVTNGGLLQADGGQIVMTAEAASAAQAAVVSNAGIVQARTLAHKKGRILLLADMESGKTEVGGTLDASAPDGGDGGFIETSAAQIRRQSGSVVTTFAPNGTSGSYLIDPQDFTIAASGGDMTGAQVGADLASNGFVLIQSLDGASAGNGDIFVNDAIAWDTDAFLSLQADRSIYINEDITATGDNATLQLFTRMDAMGVGEYYLQNGAKINLTGNNQTFEVQRFSFDYNTYTVINTAADLQNMASGNLYALGSDIDLSGFGVFDSVNLNSGQLHGLGHVINGLTVNDLSYGGLFGRLEAGSVVRDLGLTDVDVTAGSYAAGLAGYVDGATISNVFVTGHIAGTTYAGGVVGRVENSTLSNIYSIAEITGGTGTYAGGLIGYLDTSTLENAYASGEVSVSASSDGGLVGYAPGSIITNSYWDVTTTGQASSSGGTGLTTAQALDQSSYTGFDFTNTWWMADGATRPFLRFERRDSITNARQLQLMASDLDGDYTLANDIDLAEVTASASGMWDTAQGFSPVGSFSSYFTGSFDGQGHTIDHLFMENNLSRSGLFGVVDNGVIQNVNLDNVDIDLHNGLGIAGVLAAVLQSSTVDNAHVLGGDVVGANTVGMLVGEVDASSAITDSSAKGVMHHGNTAGGLVAENYGNISGSHSDVDMDLGGIAGGLVAKNGGIITDSYALGDVLGVVNVGGGLVGQNYGAISYAYAMGNVTGDDQLGGLVGSMLGGTASITDSFATGDVSGTAKVGGLVGESAANITRSYATGDVEGTDNVGGLVGYIFAGDITQSYATGAVTGTNYVGGFAGRFAGGTADGFWNTDATATGIGSGLAAPDVLGLSAAEMTDMQHYVDAGWDISAQGGEATLWRIFEGNAAPMLRHFFLAGAFTATANDDTADSGSAYSGGNGVTLSPAGYDASHIFHGNYGGDAQGATAEGTYTITPDTYSDQLGYDLVLANGTLTLTEPQESDRSDPGINGGILGLILHAMWNAMEHHPWSPPASSHGGHHGNGHHGDPHGNGHHNGNQQQEEHIFGGLLHLLKGFIRI